MNAASLEISFSGVSILLFRLLVCFQVPASTNGNVLSNRVVPICEAGCHCYGSEGNCPAYPTITDDMLPTYRELNLINPLEVRCDPFKLTSCVSTFDEGEACVVDLIPPETTNADASCPSGYSYRLSTVPSLDDAIASGQYITHTGACGTCSSLQDLALMIEYPNLPYKAQQCFFRSSALKYIDEAISCYEEIGFTTACSATLSYYQKQIVDRNCGYQCAAWGYDGDLGRPSCADVSGCGACLDNFGISSRLELLAGRTFPNSGYPSQKAQQCADVTPVDIIGGSDICAEAPVWQPPTVAPIETLTQSLTSPALPSTIFPTKRTTEPPTNAPTQILTEPPTNAPTQISTTNPTGTPTVSPVEDTRAPEINVTQAPVEPTPAPISLITAYPTITPVPLPTDDLSFQQCLSMAAIEVRIGALAGGSGIVCDCSEAEAGQTNRPRCFSSVDRNADTECRIIHDFCEVDSDCCSSGVRKCRSGSCRPTSRAGNRDKLRLSGDKGGAARQDRGVPRSSNNSENVNRRRGLRRRG